MGRMVSCTLRTLYRHYAEGGLGLSVGLDSCGVSLALVYEGAVCYLHIYLFMYLFI